MTRPVSRFQVLLAELKRRNVFKVASVYAVTAWGASLGAAELLPAFGAPDWSVRMFVIAAILGLPVAIVLAWAYEITPLGVVRDEVPDAASRPGASTPRATTVLFGTRGAVHVTWTDAHGIHERVFHGDFRIGREDSCELHLDDPMISRRHAAVTFAEGRWWIEDLGSRNGTLVNQQRVRRVPLPPSCEVKLYEAAPVLRLDVHAPSNAQTISPAGPHPTTD